MNGVCGNNYIHVAWDIYLVDLYPGCGGYSRDTARNGGFKAQRLIDDCVEVWDSFDFFKWPVSFPVWKYGMNDSLQLFQGLWVAAEVI